MASGQGSAAGLGYRRVRDAARFDLTACATQSRAEDAERAEPSSDEEATDLRDAVENPANIEKGSALFSENCSACHGKRAQGQVGPNLTDKYWLHGGNLASIYETIDKGVTHRGCPGWGGQLSRDEIVALVAFIDSIRGSDPADAKQPEGEPYEPEP